MRVLAIDTSGKYASAAIVQKEPDSGHIAIIAEVSLNAKLGEKEYTHSEVLMPAVQHLFDLTGIKAQDINLAAYTCGPGSFTGIRVGASSAMGIAFALNIPSVAVPTLDALAYNVYGTGFDGKIIPMLDARRGQVYTATYGCTFHKQTEYAAVMVQELDFSEKTLVLGDGVLAYRSLLEALPNVYIAGENHCFVRASSVGICAIKNPCPGKSTMIYVRQPQAIREQNAG